MFKTRLLALTLLLLLTTSCVSPAAAPVTKSPTIPSMTSTPAPIPPPTTMLTPSPTPTPKPSALAPARFVPGDLTITPNAVMEGEEATYSIQVSNIGGTEGSYTVVFKYKSSGGAIGSDNVVVTLEPGQTKTATFTTTKNEPGTYFVNVNDKFSQYTVTPKPTPIYGVPATSASAITSPPRPGCSSQHPHRHRLLPLSLAFSPS